MVNVIEAGSTPLKDIHMAEKKLEGKVNIIGAVLNSAEMIKKDFKYYLHYSQSMIKGK